MARNEIGERRQTVQMLIRAFRTMVIALIVANILGGCAVQSEEAKLPGTAGQPANPGVALSVEGLPPAEPGLPDPMEAYWGDGTLVIVTRGSSSCPAVPEIARVEEDTKQVEVSVSSSTAAKDCTADDAPRTFEFELDTNLAGFSVLVIPEPDGDY